MPDVERIREELEQTAERLRQIQEQIANAEQQEQERPRPRLRVIQGGLGAALALLALTEWLADRSRMQVAAALGALAAIALAIATIINAPSGDNIASGPDAPPATPSTTTNERPPASSTRTPSSSPQPTSYQDEPVSIREEAVSDAADGTSRDVLTQPDPTPRNESPEPSPTQAPSRPQPPPPTSGSPPGGDGCLLDAELDPVLEVCILRTGQR
jgi:hypothetical protein